MIQIDFLLQKVCRENNNIALLDRDTEGKRFYDAGYIVLPNYFKCMYHCYT